jgi:hypothetical protein
MLFWRNSTLNPENNKKLTNVFHGQNAELVNVTASGIQKYHLALKLVFLCDGGTVSLLHCVTETLPSKFFLQRQNKFNPDVLQ